MENASENALPNGVSTPSRTVESTPAHQPAQERFTAQQIADRYPDVQVSDVTVRTRWYNWLAKVAPERALKDGQRYTALACDLFDDFVERVKRAGVKQEDWVIDAKNRFATAWESDQVLDGELLPDEVGGMLATLQTQNSSNQQEFLNQMADIEAFITQMGAVNVELTEAEIARYQLAGAQRGAVQFKVEMMAQAATYSGLREKFINQQTQQSPQQ